MPKDELVFNLKTAKSKPKQIVKRKRGRRTKAPDEAIKTCYDCNKCTLTGEFEDGFRRYKCSFTPKATRLIPKLMNKCEHLTSVRKLKEHNYQRYEGAGYIQKMYDEMKEKKKHAI